MADVVSNIWIQTYAAMSSGKFYTARRRKVGSAAWDVWRVTYDEDSTAFISSIAGSSTNTITYRPSSKALNSNGYGVFLYILNARGGGTPTTFEGMGYLVLWGSYQKHYEITNKGNLTSISYNASTNDYTFTLAASNYWCMSFIYLNAAS